MNDWKIVAGLAAVFLFLVAVLSSCLTQEKSDFTEQCLRDHPGSHVSETKHYGYKSYNRDLYCIGPNGELWEVQ